MELNLSLFLILSCLLVLDYLSTHFIIEKYGISAEKNPNMREIVERGPIFHIKVRMGKIILAGILTGIPYLFTFFFPSLNWIKPFLIVVIGIILIIGIIWYGYAQLNNIYLIIRN